MPWCPEAGGGVSAGPPGERAEGRGLWAGYRAVEGGGEPTDRGGERAGPSTASLDVQQLFVVDKLLPYADRLERADNVMVELPYCMYDAQKKMMTDIVKASRDAFVDFPKIAVLGGIQINTPADQSDYFLPLSFEVYDRGEKIEDLTL